jgi:secondary thiamine-phosphate synthase enzyme
VIAGRRLEIATTRPTDFIDLSSRLQDEVKSAGLIAGRVYLQSLHTTLGLAVNENEPLLLQDLQGTLERLAPRDVAYHHDDFTRRQDILEDEPVNGHAHCRLLLLQPAVTLLVEEGRLVLGRWQTVFAVELDGPRERQIAIQLEGEFTEPLPHPSRKRRPGAKAAEPNGKAGAKDGKGGVTERDRELVELELARQLRVDPDPVQVPMRRLVEAGGKRLRPLLVMLAARLGPSQDPLRAAALAAAIELIHDATLVHDDYVDRASIRRGRPTVAAAEGASQAVAVGDYYFAKSTRVIAELGNRDVTATVAAAMETICLSQMDDVRLRGVYPGDYDVYLEVVRGKTAALFSAACRAGAQLSEAPPEVTDRLASFGDLLGIAFQMADDLLDYSETSGKPRGQDIRERVVSLPLIYAIEDEAVGPRVRELLSGSPSEADIERIQQLVTASGALERVGQDARKLAANAIRELERVELNGIRPVLVDLAMSAVDRSH